jgi:type VI secretion system secreted protein Hcp
MSAAVDYFLKIDGIEGESQDSVHGKEIEISWFDWNEVQSGTFSQGGGSGAGKVKMNDFKFLMRTNKSSPKLMLACATGQHIPTAKLTCRKAGGGQQEFYTVDFSEVLISSYRTCCDQEAEGADGDQGYDSGVPMDHVAFNFGKINFTYRPQKDDGTLDNPVMAGYDVTQNKPV